MLRMFQLEALREKARDASFIVVASVMAVSGAAPFLLQSQASAETLASRRVTISTSQAGATGVSYAFAFTIPSGATPAPVQSIALSFCETPLGTCTLPTGMVVGHATTSTDGGTSFTNATAFTEYTGATAGGCTDHDNGGASTQYCVTRTEATNEAVNDEKLIQVNSVTNPTIPSGNYTPVYVRIVLYSTATFTTPIHDGTVAAAIVNQLTVTGRVQERLVFCVFALDDAAGSNTASIGSADGDMPTNCTATEANESSNVDIGVIDNLGIARSPVDNSPPGSIGNDRFGAAMINTNASNGVSLTYYASEATTGTEELRAFRVPGATCNASGTNLTDQCFISADDSAGETFTAGTERFGIQIACIANSTSTTSGIGSTSNLGAGGTGSGTGGTYNTVYSNVDDDVADDGSSDCENSDAGYKFGWRDSGTAQALVSSASVVDDELVKLRFGSTANATTPTGTYTVATTFIATPTF